MMSMEMEKSAVSHEKDDLCDLYHQLSKLGRKIYGVGCLFQRVTTDESSWQGMDEALYGVGEMLQDYAEDLEGLALQVERLSLKEVKRK